MCANELTPEPLPSPPPPFPSSAAIVISIGLDPTGEFVNVFYTSAVDFVSMQIDFSGIQIEQAEIGSLGLYGMAVVTQNFAVKDKQSIP